MNEMEEMYTSERLQQSVGSLKIEKTAIDIGPVLEAMNPTFRLI